MSSGYDLVPCDVLDGDNGYFIRSCVDDVVYSADFLEKGIEFCLDGISGEVAGVAAGLGAGEGGGEFLDCGFDAGL